MPTSLISGHRRQCAMRSTAIAVASPPPMQSAATPRFRFCASSACSSVTIRRAPVAPMGWPSAQAPPLMFSFSRGMPRSLLRRHRHHGKGLVDLEQIDVADAPADLVEQLADRRDRRGGEPLRLLAVGGVALDLGEHRQALAVGERAPGEDQRRGAVGIGRGGGRRDGAVGAERRLQPGNFGGIDLQRMLVIGDRCAGRPFR